jgi:aminoglycoside 6-adenylyltransferase
MSMDVDVGRLVDTKYDKTVDEIIAWSQQDSNVEGAIVIGSQVRDELHADEWSDLDVMVLANSPYLLLDEATWMDRFGTPVCVFVEVNELPFATWNWCVKRVLFDDYRAVDFSILPSDKLDEVLSVNKGIMSKGYRVVYDPNPDLLDSKIRAVIEKIEEAVPQIPIERELSNDVSNLLFHIIWAFKKIKKGELWVAVRCINTYIRDLLLRLIEFYNASVTKKPSVVMYSGRFLEDRTDGEILVQLKHCFAKYDEQDAIDTLGHLVDVTWFVSRRLFEALGYQLNAEQFEAIRRMHAEMKAA